MDVGYARISTGDQTIALQQDALIAAGCERVFTDTMSGAKADRPGLTQAINFIREGDTLMVWRLDRLSRSLRHLIDTIEMLKARGIGFRSLTEGFDTTTPGGRLIFHVFGALAEFERELIRERSRAGQAAARARGKRGGRPRANTAKVAAAKALYHARELPVSEICRATGISEATLRRALRVG
jgi:DNA invertase Pin-like site-specific DNA recombinase